VRCRMLVPSHGDVKGGEENPSQLVPSTAIFAVWFAENSSSDYAEIDNQFQGIPNRCELN
jgi:hypothetical protein